MTSQQWLEPLAYANALRDEENLVFLYSGCAPGKLSILAWGLEETIDDFAEFEARLSSNKNKFENCWFGYLNYELCSQFEPLKSPPSIINLPKLQMTRFKNIVVFDHTTRTHNIILTQQGSRAGALSNPRSPAALRMTEVESNMSDDEYLTKTKTIIAQIHSGELYQANLTRKFHGETAADPFDIFHQLTELSPAPYSAYLKFGNHKIISASPEKFLTIANGIATTEPIKGTLSANYPAAQLANSEKDKAENLMITDLMRNDLSKTCRNVSVQKLFQITSYPQYHHLSSTITGECANSTINIVKNCFPPGSMTGAPKLKAIELCNQLENIERGVYSGALGYFGGDGSCDLSVVIRTIIFEGNKFEFQVGGGIVADSVPEKELEEIYVKAKAIFEVLNIPHSSLRRAKGDTAI